MSNETLKEQARKIITMVSGTKLIADLLTALEAAEQQVAELKDRLSYKSVANRLAAKLRAATEELLALRNEAEQLRVQLAGCGVAAMCNTHKSREEQKCSPGDYGYSASYQDVVDAVGREMALRDENKRLLSDSAEFVAEAQSQVISLTARVAEREAERDALKEKYEDLTVGKPRGAGGWYSVAYHEKALLQARQETARSVLKDINDCRFELPEWIIEAIQKRYNIYPESLK